MTQFFMFLIGIFVSAMSVDALSAELDVVFKMDCHPARQAILLNLYNVSNSDFEMSVDNFPWHPASLAVSLRAEQNGSALKIVKPLGHNDELVTIKSGAVLMGEINLANFFPGFINALVSEDVVVSVDYRPHSSDMKQIGVFGGAFTFKKMCFK